MTISVELLLNVVFGVALVFAIVTYVWMLKSDNSSKTCRIVLFLVCISLTAISIGQLAVGLLNGKSYAIMNLFMSYLWLFCVVLSAFNLNND